MRTGRPLHYLVTGYGSPQRQAGCNALGQTDYVGHHAKVFYRKHLARPPHPRLDLVGYEHDTVSFAEAFQPLEEFLGRHDVSTLSLYGFNEHGRYFLCRQVGCEELLFNPADTGGIALWVG